MRTIKWTRAALKKRQIVALEEREEERERENKIAIMTMLAEGRVELRRWAGRQRVI